MKTNTKKILAAVLGILIISGNSFAEEVKKKKTKIIQIEVEDTEEEAVVEKEYEDPTSSRVIYGPTALPNTHPKKFRITTFNLGLWNLDYAASERLNVGLQTAPPLGIYMLGAFVRYNRQLSENVHLGVYGNAGVLGTLYDSDDGVVYYGGGPTLTIGDHRKSLTFSALTYGAMHDSNSGYVVLPGVGGSIQVSNRVKLNLEGYGFVTPSLESKIAKGAAVLYGVRIFSETGSVYGDINFLLPIYKDMGDFLRYMPLGIPVLAFGFAF